MKYFLRTILVLSVVLGLVTVSFAQTKPTAKRRTTTTRRVVPLVPVGTDLKIRINDSLSSKESRVGDRFTATVIDPSRFDEARLSGHVSSIQKSGKIKGRTSMNLAFDSVELRDGRRGGNGRRERRSCLHGGSSPPPAGSRCRRRPPAPCRTRRWPAVRRRCGSPPTSWNRRFAR